MIALVHGEDRGQYSDAVLSELEGQNDVQLEGMSAKVKMLKDVRLPLSLPNFPLPRPSTMHLLPAHFQPTSNQADTLKITLAIGDEIRTSSSLADTMNDSFDNTRVRLRGTMNRMLRMAEKTGVGWRVWLGFFAAVGFVFWWVWL